MTRRNQGTKFPLLMVFCLFAAMSVANAQPKDPNAATGLNFKFLTTVEETNSDGVTVRRGPDYIYQSVPTVSTLELRSLTVSASWQPGDPSWEVPRQRGRPAITNPRPVNPVTDPVDPLLARQRSVQTRGGAGFAIPIHNFDGLRSGANPNDPNGEIGPDWYVSSINGIGGTQYTFYDKTDPSTTMGPFTLDGLDQGGPCGSGLGDPIVVYDELANRWLLTEFASGSNRLCVFVSQTGDPLGAYFVYAFDTPSFPDYPKYAVWGDAYYVGTNEASSSLYALDRAAMLAGDVATSQRFTITDPGAFGFAMIPPVDHDGTEAPPPGTPGIFIRHYDDEAHSPGSNNPTEDYLEIFEFVVDFETPANSALNGPVRIAIAEIDSELCGYTSFFCFPQMGSNTTLDPLREVVMNLPKYRNFGDRESIVGNFPTDVDGTNHGGVRWFELRRNAGGPSSWTLHQEGTVAPDSHSRFMGGSAIDASGNIALGYSTTSDTIFPGVRYTGRLESDPLGTMPIAEVTLVDGTAPSSGNRWGDYASMSVDPEDGCTFWFIENYASDSGGSRQNRIGAFKFDSCVEGEATFSMTGSNLDQQICTDDRAQSNVELMITGENGFDNPVSLDFSMIPTGISGTFDPTMVIPDGTSIVEFMIDPGTITPGLNEVHMRGTADNSDMSGTIEREVILSAFINTQAPLTPTLESPADGAVNQANQPNFSWLAGEQSGDFLLEISTDTDFADIIYSASVNGVNHILSTVLNPTTTYFWRVRSSNICGESEVSDTFSFTTAEGPVPVCVFPGLAIPDNDPDGISSGITLLTQESILDLDIRIDLSHTWVEDLEIFLENEQSKSTILLVNRRCSGSGGNGDIDVILDDAAGTHVSTCNESSPVISGTRSPDNALANFNGLDLRGTWRLNIVDNAGENVGVLNQWCLLHTSEATVNPDLIFKRGFETR